MLKGLVKLAGGKDPLLPRNVNPVVGTAEYVSFPFTNLSNDESECIWLEHE